MAAFAVLDRHSCLGGQPVLFEGTHFLPVLVVGQDEKLRTVWKAASMTEVRHLLIEAFVTYFDKTHKFEVPKEIIRTDNQE